MDDLNAQLSALLTDFVAQVTRLAREAAVSALGNALASPGSTGGAQSRRAARLVAPRTARAGGGSTSDAELGPAIVSQLLAQPGQRMEQLRDRLGQPTPELQRAIKQLLAEQLVRFEGLARGRTYFATDGATSASSSKTPKASRKRRKK